MIFLALKNLQLRKVRMAISVLAVAVGIMTLLVLRGLTEGTIGEVATRMNSVKGDLLVWDKSHSTFVHRAMSATYEQKIAPLPNVSRVAPVLNETVSLGGQAQTIYAVRPEDFEIFGGVESLESGKLFGNNGMEMLVDTVLARIAKLQIGDTVECRGETFTIVGIIKEGVVGRVFMPYQTAARLWQDGENRASMLIVKVAAPAEVQNVTQAIQDLGLIVVGKGNYYGVIAKDAVYLDAFIWSTTIVTLFVGFLTILLTMFTIIQEQTREIGILKSLGGTRWFIVRLVLAQSLLICAAGVTAGFLLSLGARFLIHLKYPLLTVSLDWKLLGTAVGVGLFGGLLGALYPALRAAWVDPVETLSYE